MAYLGQKWDLNLIGGMRAAGTMVGETVAERQYLWVHGLRPSGGIRIVMSIVNCVSGGWKRPAEQAAISD